MRRPGEARGSPLPVVVKLWAGEARADLDYIKRSVPSLLATTAGRGLDVIAVDDCSPNQAVREFLRHLEQAHGHLRVVENEDNLGPNLGQAKIFNRVAEEYPHADAFFTVDDDVIYSPRWVEELRRAYQLFADDPAAGVMTAINMPWRPAHDQVLVDGRRYLLKWKQPALNWLVPRATYERVGGFADEGIAYDTVFSHRMRLLGQAVVCTVPSYVQNIGVLGSYVSDARTTAADFVGESGDMGSMARAMQRVRHRAFMLSLEARETRTNPLGVLWPIRWGTEWVHEGRAGSQPTAVWRWGRDDIAARRRLASTIALQEPSPFAVRRARRSLLGRLTAIECDWDCSPNLRECVALGIGPGQRAVPVALGARLFKDVLLGLVNLHEAGQPHGKVRAENVYWHAEHDRWYLAWYGRDSTTEGLAEKIQGEQVGDALDARAREEVREEFRRQFGECLPVDGMPNTCCIAADLYSAARLTCQYLAGAWMERPDGPSTAPEAVVQRLPRGAFRDALGTCLQGHQNGGRYVARDLLPCLST